VASSSRPTFSKRQRELAQKDRAADKAARREDRKARALERAAAGHVGPPMGEPIDPDSPLPVRPEVDADAVDARRPRRPAQTRLYVGNLSFDTNAEELRALFSPIGEVTDVHMVTDRDTGRPRGFAFVTMGTDEAAQKAIAELGGAVVDNRQIRVNAAEDRPGGGGGPRRR